MSLTFGFYNSLNGDRKYDAKQMGQIFDGLIADGVFATVGDAMMVKANGGMDVNIGIGRAWFNHTWTYNDSPMILTLEPSDTLLERIDTVVLRINDSDDIRKNEIVIITGYPASEPQKPELIHDEHVNEYPLCYISVKRAVTEITQADITNTIGTSECPFVTGIIDTIDIDDLIAKWEAQWDTWINVTMDEYMRAQQDSFQTWFDTIKNQLSEDAAGNLQNQIYDLYDKNEFFGRLVVNTNDYNSNLPVLLDNYVSNQTSRNKRKGDQVVVVCEELRKEEVWLCTRNEYGVMEWTFFSNNRMPVADAFNRAFLYSTVWADGKYSFEDQYPSGRYDVEVSPSDICTKDELRAWCEAEILGNPTTNILTAIGTIPEIDIPIIIKVVTK